MTQANIGKKLVVVLDGSVVSAAVITASIDGGRLAIDVAKDAADIVLPSAEGAAAAIRAGLDEAGLKPEEVDYINAHGTSTPAGDIGETQAMKAALGDSAYNVAISSTKSMIGHMLGAAGGIEAVITALSIQRQIAPPTINLENQDPECDLDFVPNTARDMKIDVAMSNSFGFGGTNGSLVFKRYE